MSQTLIRLPEVKARTGLSRTAIYAAAKDGKFPKPINLTERSVAWIDTDVQAWIDARIEASRSEAA